MGKIGFQLVASCSLVVTILLTGEPSGWAQTQSKVVVVRAKAHVVSAPLVQVVPITPQSGSLNGLHEDDEMLPGRGLRGSFAVQDSVLQPSSDATALSALASPSTHSGLNVLGLGLGFPGFNVATNVPDPNGAVGPTQFVQFVNDSFAVFNKSNGSVAYGPAHGNTLWQALGAPCSTNANVDESAQFDKLANRWLMMMPLFGNPPYLCFAVSTTSDATGSWNLYVFEIPVNSALCHCRPMPDYPKLAVWSDAYYIAYDQTWNLNYEGPAACAVNRSAMLSGAASTMQCFTNNGSTNGVWVPGDLDGTTPPLSGSPEYLLNLDPNDQSLDLWQFHVDWTTPNNSTLTGPTNIPVAAFTEPCGDTAAILFTPQDNCVPQAGTTQMLNAYGDRLMYRLAYRNFGSHESLVANHTVTTGTNGGQTGIRWYELQNTGSGFGLFQQGTYAPDSNYRWMGSIAIDGAGDIALGYSVSGPTISPSIGYAGRVPSEPLGQMESETDVLSTAGVTPGSRTNNFHWADYSSLAIDPTDDCTFWYTTEYMPANGGNWSTRIASFSFPSCSASSGSYTLMVSEAGNGTVTSSDGLINCTNGTGACSAVYASGTSVTLNATAATGSTFTGWSGPCTGGNPCGVTMKSNLTATATFATSVQTHTLTVNLAGQGTVTSTDGVINCTNGSGTCSAAYPGGSSVTLNATAAPGATFTGWSGAWSGKNPCILAMNSNLTEKATFVTTPAWAIVHKTSKAGAITSLTIPATGSGHLIAVALMFNGSTSVASVSDNAGNTYASAGARAAIGAGSVEIWYTQNSVAGATVITPNFGNAPNFLGITTWEVSGALSMPPDATNIATGTVSLDNTLGPPVTTTQAGDFVISVLFAINTNFTAISSGNEFTNDFATFGNGWAHITSNSSSAGTHRASWFTSAPIGQYCASTVAFAP